MAIEFNKGDILSNYQALCNDSNPYKFNFWHQ